MWTNVFKIGGLKQISWFQFLPNESEFSSLANKSVNIDQKDAGAMLVLSSHLQLQKEGFLSTWTNSFVGPWDPSQGLHNPDEKIKLWLFLPGHHTSIVEKAKPAVSHLRVLGSGVWVAPGESEEVAAALSQALKNRIERALRGYSYIRFGDVFSRYHPSPNEKLIRRGQPVLEFIFAATEEAIFVHVMISAKHVRALSSGDIEAVFHQSTSRSGVTLPVLVSPNGMHGRLTGCCPNDLVKQVYLSPGNLRANEVVGLENQVSQGLSCQLRGKGFYAEVTMGCPVPTDDKLPQRSPSSNKNTIKQEVSESPAVGRVGHGCLSDQASLSERVLIYPVEAVLVPVMQTSPAKSYLKRFWLQNWIGPSLSGTSIFMHCNRKSDYKDGSWYDLKSIRSQLICHSSSNSNNSSISNITSSSSKSSGSGDLEADADSLACRQSGLSSVAQSNNDTLKSGSKRTRAGMSESFSQLGTVMSLPTDGELNNSTITGSVNDPTGRQYDWDDDQQGVCMDIQVLLTEFGDFGDFFENDVLPFGEPPGTAESQALMSTTPDCGDLGSSPCTSMMDVTDQMLIPIGMTSLDSFNPSPQLKEDFFSMNEEVLKNSGTSGQADCTPASINNEFDHLVKAEVMMTFAPEYGAVETPNSEVCSSIFRSPYAPKSREAETAASSSNNYVYSAKPPSPKFDGPNEKLGSLVLAKAMGRKNLSPGLQLKQYYTHVESGRDISNEKLSANAKVDIHGTTVATPSSFPGSSYITAVNSVQTNIIGDPLRTNSFFPLAKSVLASEVECLMYQAYVCKLRHTLFSSSTSLPVGLTRSSGSMVLNRCHSEPSTTTDHKSSRYEVKKQESIPVRIAGDIGGPLDGSFNTPVGVWRSVGGPRTGKPATSNIEVSPSVPQYSFLEESMLSYGLRQPLHEFLDGMALLVQQGTSFVDLALDADCTDGPFSWLAHQEQWRRGFCCGPSMVHAGCGGMLSSSHSLDISGVELVDPYSVDVQASLTISLLQSDIKSALKSAFGTLDGPLSISDWCRGRSLDTGNIGDGFSAESTASPSEGRDSSYGTRTDETSEKRSYQESCASESEYQSGARVRPTLAVVPFPAILVGYQDDWLKCSASSLKFWEKASFEPYATQKNMTYYVVCPDIDPLTTAASDFFQQLGTVYETCKLGVHSPQGLGNEMDTDSGKMSSTGFVLLDCPQSMKMDSSTASMLGSISDYFLSLSNGWDVASFLKSLSKVLKTLKLVSCLATNSKEGNNGACVVVYVVCPFPEPLAVLQTLIESSVALGSVLFSSDKERRSMLHNQVGKALSHLAAVDETLSNVVALSGSNIPKLVLQVVTVDAIFRVTSPALNELTVLKEIAFTVYNKARRISRGSSNTMVPPSSISDRSHSALMHMTPASGLWKDCIAPRVTGSSLQRESEVDSSLRATTWENSWQTSRVGDPTRTGDFAVQEEQHYMFEPLFILAEPGSLDRAVLPPVFSNMSESSRLTLDDSTSSNFMQSSASSGTGDIGMSSQSDATMEQEFASGSHKTMPSLHCCYGWTEDWRWLVCIWTDSRGELFDSYIYPFGGISGRQDTKGLQSLFIQILQQGCQILQACPADPGFVKARDFVIARIGCFFELECQEWQKALYAVGGSEMKKWSLQLRRSIADGLPTSNNGTSLQQQDIGMQERTMASPNPSYNSHSKASSFTKGSLGQSSTRKQIIGGPSMVDNTRGLHQWVHSICFVSITVDHSLQLVHQADLTSPGTNQGSGILGQPSYLEGYTPVKSLGSTSASYVLIPSPSLRFLSPSPLQLPTCLTAESPPLAHLLHSKGSAIPLSTGFVVSKAVPSMRKDPRNFPKDEWPSVLSVGLVDYYGSNSLAQEKFVKSASKLGGKSGTSESRDVESEAHLILECVAAELHALSWMTASPLYLERRSALPFHCDMVLRLRRLLYFADKELSKQSEKSQV